MERTLSVVGLCFPSSGPPHNLSLFYIVERAGASPGKTPLTQDGDRSGNGTASDREERQVAWAMHGGRLIVPGW